MRLIQSIALILLATSAIQAQRLVKLNLLEKSPLANMVVYSMNDSTANYTKLVAGTGIQITYNENDTTLTITATGTSVGVPQTLSLDDATRVLSISDGNSVDLSESIQEEINAMLVAGDNVTLTYDDVSNTLTIASTGGGGGATNIGDLGDVTITSATTGQVLKYDGAAWINGIDLNTETLSALTDVDTTGKTDGSIILYDAVSGNWEAQPNSIDNLTDASFDLIQHNLIVGDTTKIPFLAGSLNDSNQGFGYRLYRGFTYGFENFLAGSNPMFEADSSSLNIAIGKNTGGGQGKRENLLYTNRHNGSIFFGQFAGAYDTLTTNTTIIGTKANINSDVADSSVIRKTINGVLIGGLAKMGTKNSTHEIAIGAYTIGKGDSTVTLGLPFYKGTYLNGNLNLNGYGAGNKEAADLGKTGSGYFLEVATDGTLIESTVTGGTAQTLSFNDATRELSISSGNTVDLSEGIQDEIAATVTAGEGITLTYDDALGTLTVAAPAGAGNTDEQTLSINNGTAELSISNGNTVDLSAYLDEATTASNGLTLSGTDVKLGGTLSDATTTIDMNSNALTFTNNGGYNLSGTGGLSFTNTSATDYSSVLSITSTNTRIYADGGTTEPLNSLNLTSTRSGVKELDLRSSISNDNTTYTMIALNPTRFSMKTPNVTDLTATNGQFLKLVDRLTGEVEFADALTAEVDGSVTNEIQDLSLTGNTLSLSSDATTVDLSPYLDDQTVTLTGGGITAISGTYPNFTITSTEVDGSVSNEGLLSASTLISGTTAALTSNTNGGSSVNFTANTGLAIGSSGGNTITFTNTLPEATTASNGLTETGNNIALGGDLTSTTIVDLNSQNLYLVDDGATGVGISILPASNEVAATGNLSASGDLLLTSYGLGNNTGTSSGYLAGFASDGTIIEIAESTFLTSEVDGSITNEGALSVGTSVAGSSVYIQSNTSGSNPQTITVGAGLDINSSGNTIFLNTKSYPIGSGTSASIDWGSTPQKIHVLDFGANTSLTLSFSNVAVGGIYTLRVTGNSGTDTLVWPAAAKFEDGTSTGTVTLQDGGQMFTFYYDGTNYWVK